MPEDRMSLGGDLASSDSQAKLSQERDRLGAIAKRPPIATAFDPGKLHVVKRNDAVVPYDKEKIVIAISKAYLAVEGGQASASSRVHEHAETLADQITQSLMRRHVGRAIHIETIQDQVELALMRTGEHKVARSYVLYREQQTRKREAQVRREARRQSPKREEDPFTITYPDGKVLTLAREALRKNIEEACSGLNDVDAKELYDEAVRGLYKEMSLDDMEETLIITARTFIEFEPNYTYVTARLLLNKIASRSLPFLGLETEARPNLKKIYPEALRETIRLGIEKGLLDEELKQFDLAALGKAIAPQRDQIFTYLGLQTLYDRYFLHVNDVRFELPQVFFMRVAMGLALREQEREKWTIAFYNILSQFDYMSSTPTLFNAGTNHSQLSSCYLTTIEDSLTGIYKGISDNAMLSKWAGGLGNDWTSVRALGSHIKGTNGKSQGSVPFLKVANATAVAVNQGGKRKGALCAYLETWHLDIEEFLELRKNTGDERRRTPDMHTANWIPDLFMKRLHADADWTLFSPYDTADLHECYGRQFEEKYLAYERQAENGHLTNFKKIKARDLWRKMLSMLYETGHPWLTFKDACNIRSPQQHCGLVHSSNLCTEITLNTSRREIAVCNLGSINLPRHYDEKGQLNVDKLRTTIRVAVRMLDNIIDINYYPVAEARYSNMKHRPIGLGIMGFQDVLHLLRLPYASAEAAELADRSMEQISYFALEASSDLAGERGAYGSYAGSLWSRGILPIDSLQLLKRERGEDYLTIDESTTLDWDALRAKIQRQKMRNSNVLAIAPTATIANITGVSQSIEPTFQNLYVKSNLSGEFTWVNKYLVQDLKKLGMWDKVMVNDLKYYDGSVQRINRIPDDIKQLYLTAFEMDFTWLVRAAARRQKWIDQAQSLNFYIDQPSGNKLDELYQTAWTLGLKTTYYLRARGASRIEKATLDQANMNRVALDEQGESKQPNSVQEEQRTTDKTFCDPDDPDCESCQ